MNGAMSEEASESFHVRSLGNSPSLVEPPLRVWEINENSTRFDLSFAAPSDRSLHIMWSIYSSFFYVFATFSFFVFLVMVTNKGVRRNPFNLYSIFLVIPDIIFSGLCATTCAFLAIKGGYKHPGVCLFQSFYVVFGLGANSWMNAVIAYEIHGMLWRSKRGFRFRLPGRKRVFRNSLLCYGWSSFVALWGVVSIPWLPHETINQNGILCLPGTVDRKSTFFFWLVYAPLFMVIPLVYTIWVTFDIMRRNLLPPSGRRRQLAIYFFRILVVFVLFWTPCILVVDVLEVLYAMPWAVFAVALWAHFQGFVSSIIICTKPDVQKAVRQIFRRDGWSGKMYPTLEFRGSVLTDQELEPPARDTNSEDRSMIYDDSIVDDKDVEEQAPPKKETKGSSTGDKIAKKDQIVTDQELEPPTPFINSEYGSMIDTESIDNDSRVGDMEEQAPQTKEIRESVVEHKMHDDQVVDVEMPRE